jgi:hypothetical protein
MPYILARELPNKLFDIDFSNITPTTNPEKIRIKCISYRKNPDKEKLRITLKNRLYNITGGKTISDWREELNYWRTEVRKWKFKYFFNPFARGKTVSERFYFLCYIAPLFLYPTGPDWFMLGFSFPIITEIIRRSIEEKCNIYIANVQRALSDPYTKLFSKLQEKLSEIPIDVYVKRTSKL